MSFRDDINAFKATVRTDRALIFVNTVSLAKQSIVEGSALTGAPGQPVQTGNLKNSWHEHFESDRAATITTNVVYARPIEDGVGPHGGLTLRSQVGGFHSVKLTIAAFQELVNFAVRIVRGGTGA